jgi:hypothetical protein
MQEYRILDIANDFASYGEDVVKALSDPKIADALGKYVTSREQGLITKRDELLGKVNSHKSFIDGLGGEEKIKSLAQVATEAEAKRVAAEASSNDVEAVRKSLTGKIGERDEHINKLLTEKREAKVKSRVSRAVTEACGDAELLAPHITSRLRSEITEDGEVKITVLKDGQPMLVGTDAKPAVLKDLMEDMKKNTSFAKLFASSGASGSGASAGVKNLTGVVNPWTKGKDWNMTKQMEILRSSPESAATMKAAAGIAA